MKSAFNGSNDQVYVQRMDPSAANVAASPLSHLQTSPGVAVGDVYLLT